MVAAGSSKQYSRAARGCGRRGEQEGMQPCMARLVCCYVDKHDIAAQPARQQRCVCHTGRQAEHGAIEDISGSCPSAAQTAVQSHGSLTCCDGAGAACAAFGVPTMATSVLPADDTRTVQLASNAVALSTCWHGCVVTDDGVGFCCGAGAYGQLGNDTAASSDSVRLALLTEMARHVAAGGLHSYALTEQGNVLLLGQQALPPAGRRWQRRLPATVWRAGGAGDGKAAVQLSDNDRGRRLLLRRQRRRPAAQRRYRQQQQRRQRRRQRIQLRLWLCATVVRVRGAGRVRRRAADVRAAGEAQRRLLGQQRARAGDGAVGWHRRLSVPQH
eukprot:PLAT3284.9.p1 GENE.PLAT3284.9~~PLAT3284.9.p1  ORF type:complete len:329 (+),score=69.16 PLAT3284.9:904-1890(+)